MEYVSGNIFIRTNRLEKAGDYVDGHTHHFDHTTYVTMGVVLVEATLPDGTEIKRIFRSPYHKNTDLGDAIKGLAEGGKRFLVHAEVKHKITALMDDTEFDCIYSHRTPQGDITQEWTGWTEAVT